MNIGIVGCAGRMGRMLIKEVLATDGAVLAGGTEAPGNDAIGRDLGTLAGQGETGLAVGDDAAALFEASDVIVDFTTPAATLAHAALARESWTALVVGTWRRSPMPRGASPWSRPPT